MHIKVNEATLLTMYFNDWQVFNLADLEAT